MMPSPRPRSTRQALAGLQYAFGTVAPANPLVFAWRWRYELTSGVGLPVALLVLGGIPALVGTLATLALLAGMVLLWPPARRTATARVWCIITPHRVRTGCAQAWIHSRRGKIPIVLLTASKPFGERVHLWCRAGTSALDFETARPLLTSACWARDIQVHANPRFSQLVALDVIRRTAPRHLGEYGIGQRPDHVPAPRPPLNDTGDPPTWPFPRNRDDIGPAA